MIYVTGDTHGDWMSRLNTNAFPEQKVMTKDDYVIILGDFGYWHDTKSEQHALKWLENKPWTTLFVSGNHENYDRLKELPVEEWKGGKIQKIRPSIYHLMRGQIFDINVNDETTASFFTFGGASSHDIRDGILEQDDPRIKQWRKDYFKLFRINHVSWWKEELPTEAEMQEGIDNLQKHNNKVDYIITHCPYTSLLRQMDGGSGFYNADCLTDYLQTIKQTVDYKQWLFGHMHVNQQFYWERSTCMYEQISRLC